MKPLARYASLNNYVELAHSLGLDPASLVRSAGLDPAGLSLQDRWVPAATIAELLERSAAESGRDDFGLALAECRRFSNLGPLSLVIREEPDVRSALKVLMRYEHMYNEALRTRLNEHGGVATLRLTLDLGKPGTFRQSVELAVGVLHRLLQGFLGPAWQPVTVSFTHPAPHNMRTHLRTFGPVVEFEQDFDGITLYAKDLDSPNAMSDPLLRPYAQQLLDSMHAPREATTLNRVRELIELLLPTGRCSIEQVARSLGVDRRTVHRRLADDGYTFSSLLDSVRAELAGHMVGNRRYSLTEVSELLGFSSPGNFSRWFRKRFGCTPSRWRAGDSSSEQIQARHIDTT
ncbi:AraC family transcriptional regulator [Rhodococcus sp. 14C212]|uniref:AraC family transcriptional regulator n=1 Tax=Rhodococcus sp. 14C212 TaxID=2711209 RepID=UPI0013ED1E6C|nr:AraC family transcriptional regulator [Rhodococcus sp. 14C212]NGP07255.1 AraC family transcriptional regulator [Rhodococcus sp. 14C212]